VFSSTVAASTAKNMFKKGPAAKFADPVARVSTADAPQRNTSVISMDNANANDVVFGDMLAMLIPVITREQNIIMDLFGLRQSDLVKNDVEEWQKDLADRNREPIKEQKAKRLIR
jgi:hypothetical protein